MTFEDHVLTGGYGSSVLELYEERDVTTPVLRVGWPDQFIEHASTVTDLRQKYGLTAGHAVTRVKEFLAAAKERQTESAAPLKTVA